MQMDEINVNAPWGTVTMKTWGNPSDPIILCFHGYMDNAGTFNRLIPLLPDSYYYVAVDLPGHGKSSHFPPHLPIHSTDYLLTYQLVIEHFNRTRYIIMGHSYGGQLGLLYAQLYPGKIEKLILLDTLYLYTVLPNYFKYILKEKTLAQLDFIRKLKNKRPPTYTYEQALEKIVNGRPSRVTKQAAEALLERALVPVGDDKYRFSMDQRLKNLMNPLYDMRYAIETLKNFPVQCPVLGILGEESKNVHEYMEPILEYYRTQKNFTIKFVPGNHDVHNNEPAVVAPLIVKFLSDNPKSKL